MYHVKISGKYKYGRAIFKFWVFSLHYRVSGILLDSYSYSQLPPSFQCEVTKLHVKLGRDASNSIPFYGISTKNNK